MSSSRRRWLLVAVAAALVPGLAEPWSGGISGRSTTGCGGGNCHGTAANPNPSASVKIEATPSSVPPLTSADVTVSVSDDTILTNKGGFDLKAIVGTLSKAAPADATVQNAGSSEMVHTKAGNSQRTWTVVWTPPEIPTLCRFSFNAAAMAVDGNGTPGSEDHWNLTNGMILVDGSTDGDPPTGLDFQRPLSEHVYFSDIDLGSFGATIVAGPVTLQVVVNDNTGIDHVEVIDTHLSGEQSLGNMDYGGLTNDGTTNLFTLSWNATFPGPHTIKAKAVDCAGKSTETELDLIVL